MTDLGPTERRLLQALHAADEPSEADRARVRTRLLVKLGVATGVASAVATAATATHAAPGVASGVGAASIAPPAIASATSGAGLLAGTWKIGAAIAVVAAAGSGAAWVATGPHAAESAAPPAHQTEHTARASSKPAVSDTTPRSDKAAPKPTRIRARSADSAGESKAADLDGELSLLENAQQALKEGDSARALAELDRHASQHPGGALSTERAGIRAVALCEAGKISEGRREARRFLAQNPKSPLAVRVKAACLSAKK